MTSNRKYEDSNRNFRPAKLANSIVPGVINVSEVYDSSPSDILAESGRIVDESSEVGSLCVAALVVLFLALCVASVFTDFGLSSLYRGSYMRENVIEVERYVLSDLVKNSPELKWLRDRHQPSPEQKPGWDSFREIVALIAGKDLSLEQYADELFRREKEFNVTVLAPIDETITNSSMLIVRVSRPPGLPEERTRVELTCEVSLDEHPLVFSQDSTHVLYLSNESEPVSEPV
jgi:hypothetical protein